MLATDGTWRGAKKAIDEWRGVAVPALVASIALLYAAGLFLAVRRYVGALNAPIPVAPLTLTATVLAAWLLLVRLRLNDWRITTVAAGVIVLFAVGCSANSERAADWLVWSLALATPTLIALKGRRALARSGEASEVTLQQVTRTRSNDGMETIRGSLVAEYAPNERLAVLYVAFCPPLERLPSATCNVVAGPACDAKIAQLFHQGVRIEARLARASTLPQTVKIELVANEHRPHEHRP